MYTLLIVDNEAVERKGIRSLIERFQYPFQVFESNSGSGGLEILAKQKIDVILTDIKMPIMDGLQFAKEARKIDELLKIVIFSAYGEFEYAKKAICLNVLQYLLKPVVIGEFKEVMNAVVQSLEEDRQMLFVQNKLKSDKEFIKKFQTEIKILEKMKGRFSLDIQEEEFETTCNSAILYDGDSGNKVIKEVLKYISSNYMNEIGLDQIASTVYLSPGYLSTLFKKETGQSLIKYLVAYRMEKAKQILENTNMKVIDVGRRVGYTNNSYFCAAFKTYFGVSPSKCEEIFIEAGKKDELC